MTKAKGKEVAKVSPRGNTSLSLGWSCDRWLKMCVLEHAEFLETTGSVFMQDLFKDALINSGRYEIVDGQVRRCS